MLPEMDGTEVCRKVREYSQVPIMMLTARSEEADRILGLELGADDYVVKPFSPREVVARVKAILRRALPQEGAPERIELPGLTIDFSAHLVLAGGRPVALTPTEFRLLSEFASHPNPVLGRDVLLQRVWGFELLPEYQRTGDTHVKRLRAKLDQVGPLPFSLNTMWGVGYKLEVPGQTATGEGGSPQPKG